jgi:hypothetical protein
MIKEGMRVKVFDPFLFRNDKDTPLEVTMKPGIVIRVYKDKHGREVADIDFDHRGISKGHLITFIQVLHAI